MNKFAPPMRVARTIVARWKWQRRWGAPFGVAVVAAFLVTVNASFLAFGLAHLARSALVLWDQVVNLMLG